jgi:hypothetical protein
MKRSEVNTCNILKNFILNSILSVSSWAALGPYKLKRTVENKIININSITNSTSKSELYQIFKGSLRLIPPKNAIKTKAVNQITNQHITNAILFFTLNAPK